MTTSRPASDVEGDADPDDGSRFAEGREQWLGRLGTLRDVVRQELVRRQLAVVDLPADASVLDVGAGQGTQAIALARRGLEVHAVEPDEAMRAAMAAALEAESPAVASRVTVRDRRLEDLDDADGRHHLVTCHGVLLYLDDVASAIRRLAARVAHGGTLSLLSRNAAALPVRPMLRRDWAATLAAFAELDRAAEGDRAPRYRNQLGVTARGHDVDRVIAVLDTVGSWEHRWFGVRLASDALPVELTVEDSAALDELLTVEELVGRSDPYRRLAGLFHLLSRRTGDRGRR